MAVITGVLSALGTAELVLTTTRADIERLLLAKEADERQSTAALLANKLDTLQATLGAAARQLDPDLWSDHAGMMRYLQGNPSLHVLFDSVTAVHADGQMFARFVNGAPATELTNIADRGYFQHALKTDQPVVSEPVAGRIEKAPIVVIAVAVPSPQGKPEGVVVGSLALGSSRLFSELAREDRGDGSRSMVMDRSGVLLAHPDPRRVLGRAAEEPVLAEVYAQWQAMGSPIDAEGTARLIGGYLVSMAGIATSDWVLVHLTPQSVALAPVAAAQRTAWLSAIGVGCVTALLAGAAAWLLVLPISRLRSRAESLLLQNTPADGQPWPAYHGELGALARAFQKVVDQRQDRQRETQALLLQLEAVLDHAEVGIALTRNGHFDMVSSQFCVLFQCEKEQMLGESTRCMYATDDDYQAMSARAHPAFLATSKFDGELELVRSSGEPFWAHMRGRAIVAGDRSKGTIWIVEDVTQTRAHRERLAYTSSHDTLTGLANRHAFTALLEQATRQAADEPFCAMFIDLDRFKAVNDTGGHAAGDALLRDLAQQFVAQVRKSDTVARLGGDEFAVLLSNCPLTQARDVAEKMRHAVDVYRLAWEGHTFGVGSSIGLVSVDGRFADAAEVLRAADAACYAAKQQGRNRVVVEQA